MLRKTGEEIQTLLSQAVVVTYPNNLTKLKAAEHHLDIRRPRPIGPDKPRKIYRTATSVGALEPLNCSANTLRERAPGLLRRSHRKIPDDLMRIP
jgi:hypothetical protein